MLCFLFVMSAAVHAIIATMIYPYLTDAEAEEKIKEFGYNEIPDAPSQRLKKIMKMVVSPMNLMLLLAAALSFATKKDFDAFFILSLFLLNIFISFWHEQKADATIQKLRKSLAIIVEVLRSDVWKSINSRDLVPGDVVRLKMGAIIPADGKIIESSDVSCNESALTGESLPVEKKIGDMCYSGAYLVSGICIVVISATGGRTRTGKTIIQVEDEPKRSQLDNDVMQVTRLLMLLSAFAITVISGVLLYKHQPMLEVLTVDLSLVIAGIPISLPTVMSLIVSIGVMRLAEKKIIVRRLSSLQNLSGVSLLLSDKTGTLTKNRVEIASVKVYDPWTETDAVNLAIAAEGWGSGPIQQSVQAYQMSKGILDQEIGVETFIPYNSDTKHSETVITWKGKTRTVIFGAPQSVALLSKLTSEELFAFRESIDAYAADGYRTMSVAVSLDGTKAAGMSLVATFLLSDTAYEDAPGVIAFMEKCGISTKMVTGDNHAIGSRVAKELAIDGSVVVRSDLAEKPIESMTQDGFNSVAVFAEMFPSDKYHIVEYGKLQHVVAVTGDGVNDIPPVRASDVGIATSNAVDSLKESADIVLLNEGVASIKDAIIEARKIFARLNGYITYRISESFRLIFGILLATILFGAQPITAIQLIILSLLNDIPIISLAFNRVDIPWLLPKNNTKRRSLLGSSLGFIGVLNSIIFIFLARNILHLDWPVISTLFFLKLTVSGHLLILVAHTKRVWYEYLPSKVVLISLFTTQVIATFFALSGFLMAAANWRLVGVVWIWALIWMQVSELVKHLSPGRLESNDELIGEHAADEY